MVTPDPLERIRPCLRCGTLISFDAATCAECGAAQAGAAEDDRVRPCAECGEIVPFQTTWCLRCGGLALPLQNVEIPSRLELGSSAPLRARWPLFLAVAALATGLLGLALAATRVLGAMG